MSTPESDRRDTTAQPGGQASGELAPRFCGHCGAAVEPGRPFCPVCGAAVAPTASATTVAASAMPAPAPRNAETTPAWAAASPPAAPPPAYAPAASAPYAPTLVAAPPPPAPPPGWAAQQASTTWSDGMARAAYTPTNPAAQRRKPRHRVLAAISTLLLLAVLATTGYWLYGVFAAHQESAAARYVPATTILFVGVDMVQAARNGHHVSSTDLGNGTGQGDALKQVTGLDWNSDILPWLGRDIAFAVFPITVSPGNGPRYPSIGYAYLLQSRDDGAAQAAMKKAANFQTQQGNTVSTSSYAGFTLYSVTQQGGYSNGTTIYGPGSSPPTGPGAPPASSAPLSPVSGTTVTAGKGWALVASDNLAAQAVIDHINAGGNGLDTNAAFQAATRDLPADRFATLFVNLRAVVTATSPQDVTQPDVPFLDAYPAAGGYAEWTDSGVRGELEFSGQRPATVPDLSGDTTSLAQMIPAGALFYTGTANFGTTYQAAASLAPAPTNGSTPSDAFTQYFGQPAISAAFQQPAAFAVLRQANADQPGHVPGIVGLIRAPDAAAATDALRVTAQAQHWTLKPATVAGTPATDIYAPVPDYVTGPGVPPPPTSSTAQPYPKGSPTPPPMELVAVAAQVHGTFVIAGSSEDLAAVLRVASGAAPSLASSAAFQQMVSAAPSGAVTTSYANIAALLAHTPPSGSTLTNRATSLLVTTVWSQSKLALTADVQLQG